MKPLPLNIILLTFITIISESVAFYRPPQDITDNTTTISRMYNHITEVDSFTFDPSLRKIQLIQKPSFTSTKYIYLYWDPLPDTIEVYNELKLTRDYHIEIQAFVNENNPYEVVSTSVQAIEDSLRIPPLDNIYLKNEFESYLHSEIIYRARFRATPNRKYGPWSASLVYSTQDVIRPSLTDFEIQGKNELGWINRQPIQLSITAQDSLAGIADIKLFYRAQWSNSWTDSITQYLYDVNEKNGLGGNVDTTTIFILPQLSENKFYFSAQIADAAHHPFSRYENWQLLSNLSTRPGIYDIVDTVKVDTSQPFVDSFSLKFEEAKIRIDYEVSDNYSGVESIYIYYGHDEYWSCEPDTSKADTVISVMCRQNATDYLFFVPKHGANGVYSFSAKCRDCAGNIGPYSETKKISYFDIDFKLYDPQDIDDMNFSSTNFVIGEIVLGETAIPGDEYSVRFEGNADTAWYIEELSLSRNINGTLRLHEANVNEAIMCIVENNITGYIDSASTIIQWDTLNPSITEFQTLSQNPPGEEEWTYDPMININISANDSTLGLLDSLYIDDTGRMIHKIKIDKEQSEQNIIDLPDFLLMEGVRIHQLRCWVLDNVQRSSNIITHEVIVESEDNDVDVYNYPNPFNPEVVDFTNIVVHTYTEGTIEIRIFDTFGRLVKKYPSMEIVSIKEVPWDGCNEIISDDYVESGGYYAYVKFSFINRKGINEVKYLKPARIAVIRTLK